MSSVQLVDPVQHKEKILDVLCAAFDSDPHINWLIRQDDQRSGAMRALFTMLLNDSGPDSQVLATQNLHGVAVCLSSESSALGLIHQVRQFFSFWRICGSRKLISRGLGVNIQSIRRPNFSYIYLQLLAVTPGQQCKGYASQLISSLMEMGEKNNRPIFLETANPDNVTFYQRHGFSIYSTYKLLFGPTLTTMLYTPSEVQVK